jgi:hypothetical protein
MNTAKLQRTALGVCQCVLRRTYMLAKRKARGHCRLLIAPPAQPLMLPAGQLRIMPLLQHRMLLLGFKEQPQVRTTWHTVVLHPMLCACAVPCCCGGSRIICHILVQVCLQVRAVPWRAVLQATCVLPPLLWLHAAAGLQKAAAANTCTVVQHYEHTHISCSGTLHTGQCSQHALSFAHRALANSY